MHKPDVQTVYNYPYPGVQPTGFNHTLGASKLSWVQLPAFVPNFYSAYPNSYAQPDTAFNGVFLKLYAVSTGLIKTITKYK